MTDPTRRPNPNAGKQPARPQPAAAAPRPAAAKPAAPAPRPAARPAQPAPVARPRAVAPVEVDEPARRGPVRRQAAPGDEPLDATTKKGLIAAGILVVIASIIWVVIHNKQVAEKQKEDDLNAMIQGFVKDIEAVIKDDAATEAQIQAAIDRIDKEPEKWKPYSTEPAITSDRSRLVGKLETLRGRNEFLDQYKKALATVDDAANKSSEDLIGARKTLMDILPRADIGPPEAPDKIKAALLKLDHILVGKMRDEAKAYCAASGTSPRQGLAKYATAEDYVRTAIETATKANNNADKAAYTEIYKGLLQESDAYTQRVVTSEFIESIPWKDLLNGEMASKWSKVTNVPGFSSRVDNGMLSVSPPDTGSTLQGVVGILDQPADNLRNFQVDMEFSVEGVVTMYFHVSPPPGSPNNQQSFAYDLEAKDGYLKAGAKYSLTASYIGSDLVVKVTGSDDNFPEYRPDPSWAKRRRGGIAFLIPEKARLRVTKMRIRELR